MKKRQRKINETKRKKSNKISKVFLFINNFPKIHRINCHIKWNRTAGKMKST